MDGTARARDGTLYRIAGAGTPLQERVLDTILWDIRHDKLRASPEQTVRDVCAMYGITDCEISVVLETGAVCVVCGGDGFVETAPPHTRIIHRHPCPACGRERGRTT